MSDWTAGYVADIGYTFGYYAELNPLRVKLAFLNKGLACPDMGAACELGFGQGVSANLHAAATVTQWYGTDFNPAQAGFAQELAKQAGSSAQLYDESFAEFGQRTDLPEFDYIGLHGIWSWISDENRHLIVDFIRRKLKVGGVLYISYNTQPGWAAFAPLRHLMTQHAEVMGADGSGIVNRIDGALDFTEKLIATNPLFTRANPQVAERLTKIKEQNRHYIAHEYFNRDWHPMHFATMAEWLAPAKVQYGCTAHYLDHVDALNLSAPQQELLHGITDPMFKESVRDFVVNQQFRRDYWVKGARKLSPLDQSEALRNTKVVLTTPKDDVSLKVTGFLGQADMSEVIYKPMLDHLADHKPQTLGQIEQAVAQQGVTFTQVIQAAMVLSGTGHLSPVQDDAEAQKLKKQTDKLNHFLMTKARGSNEVNVLASPVTGGGIHMNQFEQLFLLSIKQGKKTPKEWADWAWLILNAQRQKLVKEGKTLVTDDENKQELLEQAHRFESKKMPILKSLMIS